MQNKINTIMILTSFLTMVFGCSETAKSPEWTKAVVLAEKLDHPAAMTTDDKNIYYVTGGTIASLDEGTSGLWKIPLAGGSPVQIFKGYQKDEKTVIMPDNFVVATDEKYVYFSAGYIYRVLKDGGEPEQITAGSPTEMVVDSNKIYWHNYVGEGMKSTPVFSVDKSGGEAKALTEAVNISAIVVDQDFLYWSQPDGIFRTPKKGGERLKIFSAPEKQSVSGLIADKDNFYFTLGDGRNALMRIPKSGGQPTKITDEINHVFNFYVDDNNVFFIKNEGSFGTSLNRISKNGGEITKIDNGYLANYTVGKDKIYVSDVTKIYELSKN